jgi:hypothetical protein
MSEDEFWCSTPRSFFNRLDGFLKWNEQIQQQEWERARFIAYTNAAYSGHAKKSLTPRKIIKFNWEKSEVGLSLEQRREIEDRIRKRYKLKERCQAKD